MATGAIPVFVGFSVAAVGAVTYAEEKVQKAQKKVDQRREDMEKAELARVRLVAEMKMLQAKEAKLVRAAVSPEDVTIANCELFRRTSCVCCKRRLTD